MAIELNTIYCGDCLDFIAKMDDKSIDAIIQDPPYNTTQCQWEWDIFTKIEQFWLHWNRILKPGGSVVMTATQPFTSKLIMSNLQDFKYEWIWVKSKAIGFFNAKHKPMNRHESVLVFSKSDCANRCLSRMVYNPQGLKPFGKKCKGTKRSSTDAIGHNFQRPSHLKERIQEFTGFPTSVLEINSEGKTVHPTQKPVELFEYLIKTYTDVGGVVFDGFVGSGTSAVACVNTGRNYIGIDINEEYCKIARKRVDNEGEVEWN